MYEEDRPKFIPKRFESPRSVPVYEKALREGFDRCLNLYLCPRTHKKRAQLVKKLESGLREISSISIHPGGDNVIVGSKDGKLCWFDTDLSTRPYKTLKTHSKDITSVTFHRKYPLFASSSEDCTAYVCHGMVYSDLNQNPLIVPLEILRGHSSSDGRGVLDCKFHPKQPWLFTSGADSVIRL
ncbi:hypothetical protein GQ55_2G106900 [Panicum hallii var. hallii]|uniref:BOP1 N-terminal domain-containing protein n=1 Tax=Panicum hallii var. hallii TaxID=1504633 RepID=A0A2T7ENL7_9POAL|nr:hypothetical protein GQ55_2G106900 [Panicum hallii var. hallii]